MSAHIIRTSDRMTFKNCRVKWEFGSQLRQNYEPIAGVKVFDFGTAFHSAMQVYYEPTTWKQDREVVQAESIAAFNKHCKDQKIRVLSAGGPEHEIDVDFAERRELGESMLRHYFSWAPSRDKFTPIHVEVKFEVPILISGLYLPMRFYANAANELYYHNLPVVYQGRVDMIVQDEFGEYWVWDHKTCKSMGETSWLAVNDQITSYCWALQHMLGIPIAGFVYNEVSKSPPHPPKELKNGGFSVAKNQNTSPDLYIKSLAKVGMYKDGLAPEHYQEFIDWLEDNPKDYVRRTPVNRNAKQLENQGRTIFLEAVDMLNNPSIYPNPGPFNCNGCWFLQPCIARQDGSGEEYHLENLFRKREDG